MINLVQENKNLILLFIIHQCLQNFDDEIKI